MGGGDELFQANGYYRELGNPLRTDVRDAMMRQQFYK